MTRAPSDRQSVRQTEVSALLATWGDEVELVSALSRLAFSVETSGPSTAEVLQAVLDSDADLSKPLRQSIEAALRDLPDSESSLLPGCADGLLEKVEDELGQVLAREGEALAKQMQDWGLLLGSEELARTFEDLWAPMGSQQIQGALAALGRMHAAAQRIRAARAELEQEIRTLRDQTQDQRSNELEERIHSCLEEGSVSEQLAVRRDLQRVSAAGPGHPGGTDSPEYRNLLERHRQGKEAAVRKDHTPSLQRALELALERSSSVLELVRTDSATPDGLSGVLGAWDKALEALLAGCEVPNAESRNSLVQSVRRRMTQELAGDGQGKQRVPGQGEWKDALTQLEAAVDRDEESFQVAWQHVMMQLRSQRDRRQATLAGAASELRETVARLVASLEESAEELPTALVVEARGIADAVEPALAREDHAEMDALGDRARRTLEELERLHELGQERKRGEAKLLQRRLAAEAARLKKLTSGRWARELQGIGTTARSATMQDLSRMAKRMGEIGSSVGRAVRREAARSLQRAAELLPQGGRPAGPRRAGLAEKVRAVAMELQDALAGDDLGEIESRTRSLQRVVGRAPTARKRMLAGLAVLAVVAAGVALAHRMRWVNLGGWLASGPSHVQLTLEPAPTNRVQLLLLREDEFEQEVEYSGAPVEVDLPDGHYYVFVGEQFSAEFSVPPGGAKMIPFVARE